MEHVKEVRKQAVENSSEAVYKEIISNTGYLLIASFLANGFLFLFNLLLARSLGADNFGLFSLLVSISSIVLLCSDIGINKSTTKAIAENITDLDRLNNIILFTFTVALLVALFFIGFLLLSAEFLSNNIFHQNISFYIKLSSIWILSIIIYRHFQAVYFGLKDMKLTIINELVKDGPLFLVVLWIVLFDNRLNSLIYGWSAAYLLIIPLSAILFYRVLNKNGIRLKLPLTFDWRIIKYGFYLFLPYIALYATPHIMSLMIGAISSAKDLSFWVVAFSLTSLTFLLMTPISNSLFPSICTMFAHHDMDRISMVGKVASKYVQITALVVLIILTYYKHEIINFLFGSEYAPAENILNIISFAVFFESFRVVADPLLNGTAHAKSVSVAEFAKFGIIIGSGVIFIQLWGLVGAAVSLLIGYLASWVLKLNYLKSKLDINVLPQIKEIVLLGILWAVFLYYNLPASWFIIFSVFVLAVQRVFRRRELDMLLSLIYTSRGHK